MKPKKKKSSGYNKGGLPMVMKDGKKVPAYAADGVGKMNMGGMTKKKPAAKMMAGGMAKKKKKMSYNDGGLVGKQAKLDMNKDGKISGKDFKMMS